MRLRTSVVGVLAAGAMVLVGCAGETNDGGGDEVVETATVTEETVTEEAAPKEATPDHTSEEPSSPLAISAAFTRVPDSDIRPPAVGGHQRQIDFLSPDGSVGCGFPSLEHDPFGPYGGVCQPTPPENDFFVNMDPSGGKLGGTT